MARHIFLTLTLVGLVVWSQSHGELNASLPPAYDDAQNNPGPWAVMVYYGRMTQDTLGKVLTFNESWNDETLYSIELSRELAPDNPLRRFLQPILSTVEVVGNFTYRDDPAGPIYEINPYLAFRWSDFPWNKYVATSLALGEGLSYDTKPPSIETENSSDEAQKLLNYLMLEATFAAPQHPQWEFVVRVHHRSGVFGLYNAENTGSTAIGLGIRYRF